MYKLFFTFVVGLFLSEVIYSYNPLMTYSVRFKKMTLIPNVSGNYTINQDREKQSISGNFTVGFTEMDRADIIFHRCDPDSINCEYFQSWKIPNVCSMLKQKNQLWSSWYDAYQPPMQCPINKVNYSLINGYVDPGPVIALYPEALNYHWKVVQKFYFKDEFVGSFTLELSFFGYRKKPKSILKT